MSATAESPPRTKLTAPAGGSTNRWLILVIACLAQFMVVLDATVVNVALPSIQHGLNFSASNLQWVVNAYTLVFGGFLLLGGRAADLLGRKRLFAAGVIVFSAASLLNGLAQTSGHADRRSRAPGPRRRSRLPRGAVDHHDDVHPAGRAHQGARRLERDRRRWRRGRPASRRRAHPARLVAVDLHRQRPGRDRDAGADAAVHPRVQGRIDPPHVRPRWCRHRHLGPRRARVRDRQGPVLRLGLGADDRAARGRPGADRRVHADRAAQPRPARAPEHLPRPDALGGRRRAAARRLGHVRDVLLRVAVRAGDPRLQPAQGRTGVPADHARASSSAPGSRSS